MLESFDPRYQLPSRKHFSKTAIPALFNSTQSARAIGVTRKLITSFSHSWKKKRDLTKVQADLGIPHHSLIIDCQTRWGSLQKMISRVLEQEKALCQVLSIDRKTAHLVPTWQDLEVLESINKALAPLADFTDIFSGEKYVTFSALVPFLKHVTDDILCEDEEDTTLTVDIKQQIITYLQNNLNKYDNPELKKLLYTASFLDPRFKTEYIPKDNIPAIKEKISQEGLWYATDRNSSTDTVTSATETSSPPAKKNTGKYFKEK